MTEEVKKDTTEQTAETDKTNTEPKDGAVADGGEAQKEDGLDAILEEFEAQRAKTQTKEPASSEPEPKAKTEAVDYNALAALEATVNEIKAKAVRNDLEKLFSNLADGVQADEVDAEAFLNAMVAREPRLNDVWAGREKNPKAWTKAFTQLKSDFTKRFGKVVDKQATESRDAVTAAVRSASTAAPTEITETDIKKMSKSDFDELQRKLGVTPV